MATYIILARGSDSGWTADIMYGGRHWEAPASTTTIAQAHEYIKAWRQFALETYGEAEEEYVILRAEAIYDSRMDD